MWSTSITLTPVDRRFMSGDRRLTIAGGSSRSSERRRAAAARKSVLAKFDHLPGEHTIGTGGVRGAGVRGDRPPGEWRLAQLHAGPHDALEHGVIADDSQLVQHVLGEVRADVEEGRQQAEDPQVTVELQPDRVDDLDQVVEALHRVELGLDRDDHAVRGDEAVHREAVSYTHLRAHETRHD